MANEERLVTEIPSSLKQLARLVVRGFYTIEDSLIVDMLVRNPCMKEDDICDLLKFDRKMLRARIASLKSDKFIQVRLRMETGLDGKAQKANYYFINYKTFVNVVKYKLDLMRKRLETEERDATSRASFKCSRCSKTFTDLEADQLFDFASGEFRCTYCLEPVEEDQSAVPKKDSRLLLAKFNEQLDPLYTLLREVEGIKLAPEVLEPEPVDIGAIRGGLNADKRTNVDNGFWSGESTRNSSGFGVEEARVDVNIINNDDDDDEFDDVAKSQNGAVKEQPIWMTESTVASASDRTKPAETTSLIDDGAPTVTGSGGGTASSAKQDDIMSVLLAHEKRSSSSASTALSGLLSDQQQQQQKQKIDDSDTSSDDDRDGLSSMAAHYHKDVIGGGKKSKKKNKKQDAMSMMMIMDEESNDDEEGIDDDGFGAGRRTNDDDDDDDEDVNVPTVSVGDRVYPINEIDDSAIAQMTQSEKEIYVQVFQDYYSHIAY